jgi:hypothetical protein
LSNCSWGSGNFSKKVYRKNEASAAVLLWNNIYFRIKNTSICEKKIFVRVKKKGRGGVEDSSDGGIKRK